MGSQQDWTYRVSGDPCDAPALLHAWSAGQNTPASTPTRRTRRNEGASNWTHYGAFDRVCGSDEESYAIGQAVLIAGDAPLTTLELRGRAAPRNGYGSKDARRKIVDDLPATSFVGIIVDIFLDEKRELNVKLQWLIRPRVLVSSWKVGEVEEMRFTFYKKELLYASDPAFHTERERNLAAQESLASPSTSRTSVASRHKTSKAQDILPAIYIERAVSVGTRKDKDVEFFVERRWNPAAGAMTTKDEWAPPLDFAAITKRGMSTGQWEHGDEERAKIANERRLAAASLPTPTKSRTSRYVESEGSSSSSEEEEEDDADVFDVRAARRDRSRSPASDEERDMDESDDDLLHPTSAKRQRAYEPEDGDVVARPRKVRKISAARQKQRRERLATRAERTLERRARARELNLPSSSQGKSGQAQTPWQRAREALHVSNTPDVLPCREDEATEIYSFLDSAIDEKAGACLYISGVPGTGKTATVRSVVRDLQEFAADGKINNFRFLEINGMKLTDPYESFSVLWKFISGQKLTAKHALSTLEEHFKTGSSKDDEVCVVLVDELDQLLTKKNDVIYNFFNWPSLPRSRLIVIAIANTMDLPERELSSKVISRLGDNRIVFAQYHFQQLIEIISSRLDGLEGVIDKVAIESAAKLVAKVTGDARRALDICRRTVERVEADNEAKGAKRLVTHADIRETVKAIDQTSTGAFVSRLSLHCKIFLLALSRCIRSSPTSDAMTSDVMAKHLEFVKQRHFRLTPSHADLVAILHSLLAMRVIVADGHGVIDVQRLRLEVRDQDLENWLRNDAVLGDWVGF